MQRTLVFIPVQPGELAAISGQVELVQRPAHTVTPELMEALGYQSDQTEEAEYAAMVLASVAALSQFGQRLVLVAEPESSLVRTVPGGTNGECIVAAVPRSAITCWFSESDDVDPTAAADAARRLSIDQAWELDAVSELVQGHQLLWNDVVEYQRQ